jgi:hypothetical protein
MRALVAALSLAVLGAVACRRSPQQPPPEFQPTATIKEIMQSTVDPSADAIWESVGTSYRVGGEVKRAPKTDEEWTALRHHAIRVMEAANLLQIPGRHVAPPGDNDEERLQGRSDELTPEQIEVEINKDRALWIKYTHGLHDAMVPVLSAIDARNPEALIESGGTLDTACENCHKFYWYPKQQETLKRLRESR